VRKVLFVALLSAFGSAATGSHAQQAAPAAPTPPPPYGIAIPIAEAKKIAAAAVAEAKKTGFPSAIAIVGPAGDLIYLEKMDNANNSAPIAAEAKARSAALYRRPSKFFEDRVAGGGINIMQLPGVTAVGGGLPIVDKGHVVGAIGSAGAPSSAGDGDIAQAGLDALK
jgi:uncharacterized protein GlcG (DUF336 family)